MTLRRRAFLHTLLAVRASRKLRVTTAQKARIEAMRDLPTHEVAARRVALARALTGLCEEPT